MSDSVKESIIAENGFNVETIEDIDEQKKEADVTGIKGKLDPVQDEEVLDKIVRVDLPEAGVDKTEENVDTEKNSDKTEVNANHSQEEGTEVNDIRGKPDLVDDNKTIKEIVSEDFSEARVENAKENDYKTENNAERTEINTDQAPKKANELTDNKCQADVIEDEEVIEVIVKAETSEATLDKTENNDNAEERVGKIEENADQAQNKETEVTDINGKPDLVENEEIAREKMSEAAVYKTENIDNTQEKVRQTEEKANQAKKTEIEVTHIKGKGDLIEVEEVIEEIVREDLSEAAVEQVEEEDNTVENADKTEAIADKIVENDGDMPTEVNEASNDFRNVDAEGWEDLLGSGRLRKRVIIEGDPKQHARKGSQVKIHFTGQLKTHSFVDLISFVNLKSNRPSYTIRATIY